MNNSNQNISNSINNNSSGVSVSGVSGVCSGYNIESNDILFKKVWRNKYLNKIIFEYVKVYNIFYKTRCFITVSGFKEFKLKEYLRKVAFGLMRTAQIKINDKVDLNNLPSNIESVIFNRGYTVSLTLSNNKLPSSIRSIETPYIESSDLIKYFKSLNNNSNNNNSESTSTLELSKCNLEKLSFNGSYKFKIPDLAINLLPNGLVKLKLVGYQYQIKRNVLPNTLQKLWISYKVCDKFDFELFEEGSIPDSVVDISIENSFSLNFIINGPNILPKKLEKLKFYGCKSCKFNFNIPNDLFTFPSTLKELSIKCKNFNFKLPPNLEKFKLESLIKLNQSIADTICIPDSLKSLKISSEIYQTEICKKMIPRKLKSLIIQCSSILDPTTKENILPDTLEKLVFIYPYLEKDAGKGFNQRILPNQLPSNLKYLDFSSKYLTKMFNFQNGGYPLDESVLPDSLTYLNLGCSYNFPLGFFVLPRSNNLKEVVFGNFYNHEILPQSIPSSVKVIRILNRDYQQLTQFPNNNNHPNLLVEYPDIKYYLESFSSKPELIRKIKFPFYIQENFKFRLYQFTNLEYLELPFNFNLSLNSILPENNQIRTLRLIGNYSQIINLEFFPNLETLIVNNSVPTITTTKKNLYNNNISNYNNSNNDKVYSFYKLENIIVSDQNIIFLNSISSIYYQFIKLIKLDRNNSFLIEY